VECTHRNQQTGTRAMGGGLDRNSPDPPEESVSPLRFCVAQRQTGYDQGERAHEESEVLDAKEHAESLVFTLGRWRAGLLCPARYGLLQPTPGFSRNVGSDVLLGACDYAPVGLAFEPFALIPELFGHLPEQG
jgi:hypothetical protein